MPAAFCFCMNIDVTGKVRRMLEMEWPKSMLKDAERRMEGCLVEGFVPGKGNRNAEIMLVGEAPGEKEAVEGFHSLDGRVKSWISSWSILVWNVMTCTLQA